MPEADVRVPVNRTPYKTLYRSMSACPEYLSLDRPVACPENRPGHIPRDNVHARRCDPRSPVKMIHSDRRQTLDVKQALDRFLAGVERRAFVTARLATRDGDEALDIVQDAMLSMIRSYTGRPEAEWGPLFHSVLQSRIQDWRRRTRVRRRWRVWLTQDEDTDEDPLANLPDRGRTDPAMQAADRRTLAALENALMRLPARQQQAFLLRTWEGLDVAQTARAMDCSEGSVKTHYSRAVQTLRGALGDHWP